MSTFPTNALTTLQRTPVAPEGRGAGAPGGCGAGHAWLQAPMPAPMPAHFPTLGTGLWPTYLPFLLLLLCTLPEGLGRDSLCHKMACDKTCLGPRERREGLLTTPSLSNQVQDKGAGPDKAY